MGGPSIDPTDFETNPVPGSPETLLLSQMSRQESELAPERLVLVSAAKWLNSPEKLL